MSLLSLFQVLMCPPDQPPQGGEAAKPVSLWREAARRYCASTAAVTALLVLGLLVAVTWFGPLFSSYSPDEPDWDAISSPPQFERGHYFGTDGIGRDLFVRTLYAGQTSLTVGLIGTLVSLVIGVSYGAIAGYLGGRVDALMMRIVDVLYALPFMFFVILLMVYFGRDILLMFVAIGAVNWLDMARIVRGQTMSLRNREFVVAAVVAGSSTPQIIVRHIVPNLLGIVVVYVTLTVPQVILVESFLSFLGLGIQEPQTSWGALVNEGAQEMESSPWVLLFPAGFLAVTLFCLNFIGDGLRDALDPRDRGVSGGGHGC